MKAKPGYHRQWVKCKKCNKIAYFDFIPYRLSPPITILPCKHSFGLRKWFEVVEFISEKEA